MKSLLIETLPFAVQPQTLTEKNGQVLILLNVTSNIQKYLAFKII